MSSLERYFSTDWSAMTGQDWAGLIITVLVFLGMAITFWIALRPSKRKEMEEQKYKILNDDDQETVEFSTALIILRRNNNGKS